MFMASGLMLCVASCVCLLFTPTSLAPRPEGEGSPVMESVCHMRLAVH